MNEFDCRMKPSKTERGGLQLIYTVTFNPSLDYIVGVKDFKLGATNRTSYEQMLAGGKGINVSYVLKNLGFESTAIGFLAGFVGEELKRRIVADGINADFLTLEDGISRINVKLKDIDGTEINGMGPDIAPDKVKELRAKINALKAGDILVLAGSIPQSMPDTIYMDIMADLQGRGVNIVVDATRDLLMNVLSYKPFLIKPNNHELGEIFGVVLRKREEVIPYARKLQEKGARNVLVSMAGEGAVLIDENGREYMSEAPEGKVVNAVGAGDSMVAGFIAGYLEKKDYEYAFHKGLAAGSASAFSEQLATDEEVEALLEKLEGRISNPTLYGR
jgi:1-phosphofructokinase